MAEDADTGSTGMLLAKIRGTDALLAVAGRASVEPLRAAVRGVAQSDLALDGSPQWFRVRTEPSASPWDQAHARVAAQLGIDESDVLFVEPDLVHSIYRDAEEDWAGGLALGADCRPIAQDAGSGKRIGEGFAWHLNATHSQLSRARSSVAFSEPRTTIAHLDTGWSRHETEPAHLDKVRQRNFVDATARGNAEDPDNDVFLVDNSGHGTGTLSILAGASVTSENRVLGGAPEARVVPIRVADRVILLRTSSLATAIMYASDIRCAVATLSMGGLPSKAWAEAVDEAYERGLCLVAAAGNRIGELPPRTMVYPARYARVMAVTGVMADGSPYENLSGTTIESCYGPESAMDSAIAAYTPNIPWAKFGCPTVSRLNGEGTSAATPQVAAAAALWIEHHKNVLPDDWRRVEAVRHALFTSAKVRTKKGRFGHGILQAHAALGVAPNLTLGPSARSRHNWAFLRMLTGLAVDGESPREEMFNLELAQLWLTNPALSALVPDPEPRRELPIATYKEVLDAVLEDPYASSALRRHLRTRYPHVTRTPPPVPPGGGPAEQAKVAPMSPPAPPHRRLRVFAKDPTLASAFATSSVGHVTLEIPWEPVDPTATGFRTEYLDVVDDALEPAGDGGLSPGLDHPHLLAQDGWAPTPGHPQFHQQMVYAVARKTIEHFEVALGRPVLWNHRPIPGKPSDDSTYVPRLTARPHAFLAANAYYSSEQSSLLFGFFTPGEGLSQVPTFPVYTCLSYDIVAHETTHAILDGMYRRFAEPTNIDVLAFHEAFADIVALLQSFDLTELLEHQIQRSRGDLRADTMLGKLAIEFGNAARGREALRSAIGSSVVGTRVPSTPD
ncbi:MAG: S8 family serine peptidase, partial [Acidimicrobiia bacterium]